MSSKEKRRLWKKASESEIVAHENVAFLQTGNRLNDEDDVMGQNMDDIFGKCPHCQVLGKISSLNIGNLVRCESCKGLIRVE